MSDDGFPAERRFFLLNASVCYGPSNANGDDHSNGSDDGSLSENDDDRANENDDERANENGDVPPRVSDSLNGDLTKNGCGNDLEIVDGSVVASWSPNWTKK